MAGARCAIAQAGEEDGGAAPSCVGQMLKEQKSCGEVMPSLGGNFAMLFISLIRISDLPRGSK